MLDRALRFLLARQGRDGFWRDFLTLAGEGVDWPTAFIGSQLALSDSNRVLLKKAAGVLATTQHADGGWGYHAGVPTDADSTAFALLFLASVGGYAETLERGATCLGWHQDPVSGGVSTYREPGPIRKFMGLDRRTDLKGWCSPHLEVTAAAGRAFDSAGNSFRSKAEAAWRYVRSRQCADGSWKSYWWTSPHFPTLQAALLARKLDSGLALRNAAAWALREQHFDGGWGLPSAPTSPFATALSLSILVCAGQKGRAIECAVARLLILQKKDGGWPSRPMMRIPPPGLAEPDTREGWREDSLGTGVVIRDQNRTFTTAVCVGALASARDELV